MKRFGTIIAILIVFALVLSSCVSTPEAKGGEEKAAEAKKEAAVTATPMYYGRGDGKTASGAINAAKIAALRKAAADAVGIASAAANKDKLDGFFGAIDNVNAYVLPESMQTIAQGKDGEAFYSEIGIKINLEALGNALRAKEIIGGQVLPQGGTIKLADQSQPGGQAADQTGGKTAATTPTKDASTADATTEEAEPEVAEATADEKAAVKEIVDNLTYMVYFDEKLAKDPFLMNLAVNGANKYLADKKISYVNLSQIQKIKDDQAAIFEEETGEAVSVIQWIASKLNADVYVVVSLDTSTKIDGKKYTASAKIVLENFDSSTAAGRGSASYQTIPPALSTVSPEDALNNAVSSASYKAMEEALRQARQYTERELTQGLKYDLIVVNTPDSKVMRDFQKALERKTKSVKRVSFSDQETKYEVRFVGRMSDLEDLIYDVASTVNGLQDMRLVTQRGSSITFNTGM